MYPEAPAASSSRPAGAWLERTSRSENITDEFSHDNPSSMPYCEGPRRQPAFLRAQSLPGPSAPTRTHSEPMRFVNQIRHPSRDAATPSATPSLAEVLQLFVRCKRRGIVAQHTLATLKGHLLQPTVHSSDLVDIARELHLLEKRGAPGSPLLSRAAVRNKRHIEDTHEHGRVGPTLLKSDGRSPARVLLDTCIRIIRYHTYSQEHAHACTRMQALHTRKRFLYRALATFKQSELPELLRAVAPAFKKEANKRMQKAILAKYQNLSTKELRRIALSRGKGHSGAEDVLAFLNDDLFGSWVPRMHERVQ